VQLIDARANQIATPGQIAFESRNLSAKRKVFVRQHLSEIRVPVLGLVVV
jgi:hypothetical protein